MKFLSAKDILNLRFLSKRFYNITFFDKKMKYCRDNSHNLFEVDDYYNTFFYMINDFLNNFKKKVDEVTFLFLKYSLEELKNMFMISNVSYHLFSCPRSFFAKSNCSRVFISESIGPINFDNFTFNFSDDRKTVLSDNSLSIMNKSKIVVFFNSLEEMSVINSSQKRSLKTFVVQDYLQFVLIFFEVKLRIFCNFFYKVANDNYITSKKEKKIFLKKVLIYRFFLHLIVQKKLICFFEEMFNDYKFLDSNIKIINKKYIENCNKKNAD